MNCKHGDLAVIVRSVARNEGKIVRCLRLHSSEDFDLYGGYIRSGGPRGVRWVIEGCVFSLEGSRLFTVADAQLRPLRDNDGQDEMLMLVGLPVGTPQEA